MRALCWGSSRWGVRRLLGHIKHLPRDSAFTRSLSGEFAYWDEQTELLASVYDSVERLSYYSLRMQGNEVAEPVPFRRPGVKEIEEVSFSSFAEMLKE